jgi:SAM-dependent methyltransferase
MQETAINVVQHEGFHQNNPGTRGKPRTNPPPDGPTAVSGAIVAGMTGIDFEAIYQGRPIAVGLEPTAVPWDIGAPQPAIVELERDGRIHGEVLDAGCGRGDNATFLAGRGFQVTAVDASPTAIEQARERAGGAPVTFAVADALTLEEYAGCFDTIVDSALYHCLPDADRPRYARALHAASRPGATLLLLCISDAAPEGMPPSRVTRDDLRATLTAAGWEIERLEPTTITTVLAAPVLQFLMLEAELETGEGNRVDVPAWLVQARRR